MSDAVIVSPDGEEKKMLIEIANNIIKQIGCLYGREAFYRKALCAELVYNKYNACQEVSHPVYYKLCSGNQATSIGNIFIDIMCDDFFLELKNTKTITAKDRAQCKLYCRILKKRGYLLNFSVEGTVVIEEFQWTQH